MDTHHTLQTDETKTLKERVLDLVSEGQFPVTINTPQAHQQALLLCQILEPNYNDFSAFIEVLEKAIADWDAYPTALKNFYGEMANLRGDEAVIRTLMKEWQLGLVDIDELFDEYGIAGELLDGSRKLTRTQINLLTEKFGIASFVFFHA